MCMIYSHPYFLLPLSEQRRRERKVWIGVLVLVLLILLLAYWTRLYGLGIFAFLPFQLAAPFVDIPVAVRKGKWKYLSPLLLAETCSGDVQVLHGPSLFDYWYILRKQKTRTKRRERIFYDLISGLLAGADQAVREGKGGTKLKATSFFFSERTAKKFGFQQVKRDPGQWVIMGLNGVVLWVTYGLITGRWWGAPLGKTISVESTWALVEARRNELERWRINLEKRLERLESLH